MRGVFKNACPSSEILFFFYLNFHYPIYPENGHELDFLFLTFLPIYLSIGRITLSRPPARLLTFDPLCFSFLTPSLISQIRPLILACTCTFLRTLEAAICHLFTASITVYEFKSCCSCSCSSCDLFQIVRFIP